ncbi:MAG: FtsX-like permease family protein [Candidatus Heimdallarchaeota archaeon]|nr:MAG: FtsX-like permease family protein [Candidatus Heimdallarchaeota archaeon]
MGYKKQLNLCRYAFRNVQVYRGRTISILISLSIIIGLLSAVDFLREGINQDADASLAFAPDVLVQGYEAGRLVPIENTKIAEIEGIEGVRVVSPRVWGYLSAANRLYTMMGIEFGRYPLNTSELAFEIRDGRIIEPNESHPVCIIGSGVAEDSSAQVGSWLLLTDINGVEMDFEVIGIFSVTSKIYSHDLILTDIQFSRIFFNMDTNYSTDIAVWSESNSNSDSSDLALVIADTVDGIKVIDKFTMGNLIHHSTNERAGYFTIIWSVLLIGSLLFTFTISSAVSIEARKEIGLLKTLGFSTFDVLEIRIIEYTMTGFIASTIGIFCAIIYDFYLGAPILANFMLGWSVLFPPYILPLKITFESLLVAYGIGIIPLLIGVIVPAWRNAITEPDEVLRGL